MANEQDMTPVDEHAVPLLARADWFPPWLRWGFTTRHGGVSCGPYATLNFGWDVGDDRSGVRENHRRLAATLGYRPETLATVFQVHGKRVHVVRTLAEGRALRGHHGDGIVLAPHIGSRKPTANGQEPMAALAALVRVADCCPVIVAALDRSVAAVLHCGWRSQIAGLIAEGVATIARESGRDRPALAAAIGPCIGPAVYEVGEDVAALFAERAGPETVLRRPAWPRPHVDLQLAARLLLIRAGVPDERIVAFRRCTFSESADFHSFRRHGHDGGRQVGVIAVLATRR